jgi:ankyrin repeat protein
VKRMCKDIWMGVCHSYHHLSREDLTCGKQSKQKSPKQLTGCTYLLILLNGLSQLTFGTRFLLAQLHMDSLIDKPTPGDIKLALQSLPKGSGVLQHVYEQAVERIEGQKEGFRKLAKRILSWITLATRPLSATELQHALATKAGKPELDEDFLPEVDTMISVCAGLVTVDHQSGIIRWVHYTAQEYFESIWASWVPNAQVDITTTCLTYLSFNVFAPGRCLTDNDFEARLQSNALYDYAARNWGHHAYKVPTETEQFVLSFLESEAKVSCCSQAMMANAGRPNYSQSVPRQVKGMHLVAYFGLKQVAMTLLNMDHHAGCRDSHSRTPLSRAAENGHGAVVELLLAKDSVGLDSKDDEYGRTPLSWAAMNGHEAVVGLLLAKDDVNPDSKDRHGRTPLSWAAEKGHEAVVGLLLAKDGVDPDSKGDRHGRTPLSWAAENGHEAVVGLLLAKDGVDPDSKDDEYGRTPLSWAAENGHKAVVELLLAKDGVDSDSKSGRYGRTPLSWAAMKGHEMVVGLLLAKDGVDPDSKDNGWGQTPLSWAAMKGHKAVVELLLAKDGVDPDSKDNRYGRTPLSWAAENGHEAVVGLLLAKDGVDPGFKDLYGQTPLLRAAMKGHEAVVGLLLAKDDVDPDSKDRYGRTPLSWAATKGHEAVVGLLLAKDGVDPDSKDDWYARTPLSRAAMKGHEAVVRLLESKTR